MSHNSYYYLFVVNKTFASKLRGLDGYEIVLICDDSGQSWNRTGRPVPDRPVRSGPVQPGPTFQTGRSSPVFTGLFLIFDNSLKDQKLLNFAHFYGFNDFDG